MTPIVARGGVFRIPASELPGRAAGGAVVEPVKIPLSIASHL